MNLSRRNTFKMLGGAALATVTGSLTNRIEAADKEMGNAVKGRINHSACRWCYESIPLDDFAKAGKKLGLQSIELLKVSEFETVKKHDLTCAMVSCDSNEYGIKKGWNKKENHEGLIKLYEHLIDETSKAGFPNLICFSGDREGMSDEEGMKNCAIGLKKIVGIAEKKNVRIVMELLNSKVDHKDYMCDHTKWGAGLCDEIGSDNFKLLYDIYHMQIMEGDVIRTIKDYHKYIAHYHTGGVPGRHEIDNTQELNYATIMKAIAETGHKGYVAQEFMPVNPDKLASLKNALKICEV